MPIAEQTFTLDGEMALETNVSHHSGNPKTYRVFKDLITDVARRIIKREGRGATLGSVAGTEIQALHEFTDVNPVSGVETYHILGAIDGGSYIYRWNGVTTWVGQTLPITPTPGSRWGFASAGSPSRVFAFNGRDALLIGRQAASIITLASAGTTATATSTTPHPFLNGETVTIAGALPVAYNGAYVITVTGASTFTYTFAGGTSPATGGIRADTPRLLWTLAGQAAPTFAATYSLPANDPPVTSITTGTTVSVTKGSKTVTNSGTSFITGAPWVGKRITINGIHYVIAAVGTTSTLTLTEEYKEPTLAGLSWSVYPGIGDWDIGPIYSWAYYNEDTGHCSKASPRLQVTERAQVGKTITITIPASSENLAAWNNGYRKIRLFRTAKEAGIPIAINELLSNVNDAVTAITYVETAAKFSDTHLTNLEEPRHNSVPPAGIASVAYHQGRGWFMVPREGKLYFTPLSVEVPLGLAIECSPANYFRDEGGLRGLLVVGGPSSADALVIQTSHGDYSVDGFDNTTFSLYRLPTRASGGYLGGAASVGGNIVEFYADKRLMVGTTDIALLIQDRLSLVKDALVSNVRVHWFSARSYNFVIVSIPSGSGSTANDYTYVIDLDKPLGDDRFATYEWNFGISAMATVHNSTTKALELFIGDAAGAIYRLFAGSYQDAAANYVPTLKTSLLRLPEMAGKLKFVTIYVNDPAPTWTGRLYLNEQTNPAATDGSAPALAFKADEYRTQSAQGNKLTATLTESLRSKSEVFQVELTFPTTATQLIVEKMVVGYDIVTTAKAVS